VAASGSQTDSVWPALFETAFTQSQNPMALTDDERRFVRVNGAFAQLLGYQPSVLVGRHTYDLVVGGPLMSQEEWQRTIERGEVTGEAELHAANGETVHTQFGVHPHGAAGRRLVLFVVLTVARWGRHYRRPVGAATGTLSSREHEVVSMIAHGATSSEIARALQISPNTVRKHVNNAMKKLGARSRAHLVAKVVAEAPHR